MANKELAPLLIEGNFIARINQQAKTINALSRTTTQTSFLSDITNDLGDMRAGRFIALSIGDEPTDSNACGVVIDAAGETFGDVVYNLYGLNYGSLTFGLRADDGVAVFLNGNAIIGTDGIDVTDTLKWIVRQTATNSTYTRTARIGMALPEGGGTIPCLEMSLTSPAGTELITNGDFATGDFTGWTKTTEMMGSWIIQNGNGVFAAISSACSGVLTSDRVSGITAGVNYLFESYAKSFAYIGTTITKVEVKWYDHASAGSLIQTDLLNTVSAIAPPSDSTKEQAASSALTAPTGALSFSIVATVTGGSPESYGAFTISASAVTVNTKLQLRDDGVYVDGTAIGGSYPRAWYSPIYLAKTSFTCAFSAVASQWGDYVWGPTAPNANDGDEYIFYIPLAAGSYTLSFRHMGKTDRGKIDCYWDGVKQGSTTDLYASAASYNVIVTFAITNLTDGQHTLMFKVNGKNASSSDYRVQGNDLWIKNV